MTILFSIAALVAVVSTFMVITRTNAIHALLYMIISLLSVAVIFFLIGVPFVGALEIVVYAGAIMVLFVFVVMMLNLGPETEKREKGQLGKRIWSGPAVLVLILLGEFIYILIKTPAIIYNPNQSTPKQVGISLFSTYLLGVELAGMLLLAGIVGAYHLGREKKKNYHRFFNEGLKQ